MASFSTSCCQHQFWRLPCLQKKFDAQKLREQKCLPLCLVVIRRFLSNILWEEKSCLWKLHGGATRKSTFCDFFSRNPNLLPILSETCHSNWNIPKMWRNTNYIEGQGVGVISSMRLSYARNGLKYKMNIFWGERGGDQPVGTKSWLFLKHFSVLIICRRSLSSLCLCTRWKEEGNDTFFSFTRLWDLNDSRLYKIEEGTTHLVSWLNRLSYYPARALRALGLLLADGAPTVGRGKTFWWVNWIFLRKLL